MGWSEKYWEDVKSELEQPATEPLLQGVQGPDRRHDRLAWGPNAEATAPLLVLPPARLAPLEHPRLHTARTPWSRIRTGAEPRRDPAPGSSLPRADES